jgi:DNA-binding MarR family transcriptional regulator
MSALAFGQDYRLELMLYIADGDGIANLGTAASDLGLTSSKLQRAWTSLRELGLLSPLPVRTDRTKDCMRVDSHAWAFARELRTRALEPRPRPRRTASL